MSRKPIFAANWKMNKLGAEVRDFLPRFAGLLKDLPHAVGGAYDVILAPAAPYLAMAVDGLRGTGVQVAAQNCGPAKSGAFTGEVSPEMVRDLGAGWVILGHSERRHVFGEDDKMVLGRVKAALAAGLNVMLCVGEKLEERRSGSTFSRIETQLAILNDADFPASGWDRLAIAYEPVWAIGTGENATPAQAQEVHAFLRRWLGKARSGELAARLPLLYGGSVKAENATELMAQEDVDGLLVGGASLDPVGFAGVVRNGLVSAL